MTDLTPMTAFGVAEARVETLGGLTRLTSLGLQNTTVSDLSFVKDMAKLRSVNLQGSAVPDLSPLMELPELKNLSLSNATGADPAQVAALEGKGVKVRQ